MLLRHLSYFVALARERHFARAADQCNIAQPTLSAAIRTLEADIGAQLVVRSHKFVSLTTEGEHLLVWGQQILSDYHSLKDDLSGLKRGLTGVLRLGVIPAAMPAVPFISARFAARHPAATIEIQSLTSRSIARGLDALELDGGMTYLDNEPIQHVRRLPLYRERYVFIMHRGHALSNRTSVTWQEAAAEPLCLLSEDMQNRRIINRLAASIGIDIKPVVTSNSFLAVSAHLRLGAWASIVPHTFLSVFGNTPDLVAVDLTDPVHSQSIGLVLSDRDPQSPMAAALLDVAMGLDLEAEWTPSPQPA